MYRLQRLYANLYYNTQSLSLLGSIFTHMGLVSTSFPSTLLLGLFSAFVPTPMFSSSLPSVTLLFLIFFKCLLFLLIIVPLLFFTKYDLGVFI